MKIVITKEARSIFLKQTPTAQCPSDAADHNSHLARGHGGVNLSRFSHISPQRGYHGLGDSSHPVWTLSAWTEIFGRKGLMQMNDLI